MRKIFLFTDKGEDYCFTSKLVNKAVIDYPIRAAYGAKADRVYLISNSLEVSDKKIKRIRENEISNHIDEGDYLVFFSANMPRIKASYLQGLFEKLDDYEMIIERADKEAVIYALKGEDFLQVYQDDIRTSLEFLSAKLSKISHKKLKSSKKLTLVDSYEELSKADAHLRKTINKQYLKAGVFIEAPETVTIEAGVKIGKGTRIETGARILGQTVIGENCLIGTNSKIVDSIIHNKVQIYTSYVEKAEIEDYTNVGPFSRIRPNTHLEKNVHIGNFVEVKNSSLGQGTKAGHLAYIGDADLGRDINVSCGVIFANYDGKFKHRALVEDGAFLGSNVNLVAPIQVEKNAFIAAGSTVTKDVKEGYLVVERSDRVDIKGYADKKRQRDLEIDKEKKAIK